MTHVSCADCNYQVSESTSVCPKCGSHQSDFKHWVKGWPARAAIVAASISVVWWLFQAPLG